MIPSHAPPHRLATGPARHIHTAPPRHSQLRPPPAGSPSGPRSLRHLQALPTYTQAGVWFPSARRPEPALGCIPRPGPAGERPTVRSHAPPPAVRRSESSESERSDRGADQVAARPAWGGPGGSWPSVKWGRCTAEPTARGQYTTACRSPSLPRSLLWQALVILASAGARDPRAILQWQRGSRWPTMSR